MFGTTQHHLDGVSVSSFLFVWLDSTVLARLLIFVNRSLADYAEASTDDIYKFLEVELWLSVIGVTPDFFYDESNRALYPPAEEALPLPRYHAILAALSGNPFTKEGGSDQWTAPLTPDRDISYAYELARRLSADIGFVDGTTIASLDDDLIRLRSKAVDDIGLTHVRSPKKGYGPVQHGVVSLVTGLFLGGHVAANGESTVDIVRILQRSLCGSSTENQIRLPGILHALDRGYQSHAVNQQIVDTGGSIIGTHKRTQSFPLHLAKHQVSTKN
ncbi:hypothetical protein PInf_021805 [Phytophthora infestans]|nr:hypothetical protein PInf_021805 [Phytophthora infestans]